MERESSEKGRTVTESDATPPVWKVFLDGSDEPAYWVPGDTPLGDVPEVLTRNLAEKDVHWRRAEAIHTHVGTSISFTRPKS